MRRVWQHVFLAGVLAAGAARTAAAQEADAADQQRPNPAQVHPVPGQSSKSSAGFRVFFNYDANFMAASQSFNAVLDTSTLHTIGGGGEILRIWKQVFVRFDISGVSKDGTRAFALDDGTVVKLGIPTTISMMPIEIGAGWRFVPKPAPVRPGTPPPRPTPPKPGQRPGTTSSSPPAKATLVPYAGGGLLILRYKETSPLGTSDDNTNQSFPGFFGLAGLEVPLGQTFFIGGEAQYRSVPNAIGTATSAISTSFNETNLGGFTVRLLIGIRK